MTDGVVLSRAQGRELPAHGVSISEAFRVWLRVAALSFGGPAGQIAVMHRILVEEKKWVSESRFMHALNYCMLLPGPEAQQLATYIGWLMHRARGGIMAGGLFVLPGMIALMALSIIYAEWGQVGFVGGAFFGLKAAVLAIVVEAVIRIGKRSLKSRPMQALAAAAFVAIFFFAVPFPLIIIAAGMIGFFAARAEVPAFMGAVGHGKGKAGPDGESLLGEVTPDHARPSAARALRTAALWLALWLIPTIAIALIAGSSDVFTLIAVFFSKMALVTFGGAYAVLAYVAQQAVSTFHWVTPGEMLDGLGMAETTPGPLVMVLQFVGFMAAFRAPGVFSPLIAGALGGLLATWVTFAPCFLWIFVGAPYIEHLRGHKLLSGALSAITAAVVGVVLNLAVWFAAHVVFRVTAPVRGYGISLDAPVLASLDVWSLLIAVGAAVAIFRFKIGMIPTLALACVAGVALHTVGVVSATPLQSAFWRPSQNPSVFSLKSPVQQSYEF
jgi:chromate transporter